MKVLLPSLEYCEYTTTWDRVATAGLEQLNLDAWAGGHRYLSLTAVCLTPGEAQQLHELTERFSRLIDVAVNGLLEDRDWWSELAWPVAAVELARQEPNHPHNMATLYGRFDCLLDQNGTWQIIEYNADTPSGGREATGLEPNIARRHNGTRRLTPRLARRLVATIHKRVTTYLRPVTAIGVVAPHSWLEDIAQATWLADLLAQSGYQAFVGDVTDLAARGGRILLRGRPIDALYRFYPVERLYRHAIFADIAEASIDERLLSLNGLRGFLAQSKACLAWLWSNRCAFSLADQAAIEQHLPVTLRARDPLAVELVPRSVVKHVNGREGDSVVFGSTLQPSQWEARLIEGGYVVQRAVDSVPVCDVEVDDVRRAVQVVSPRYACVGAFSIGGQFAGCYTRLDGPITSARATYAATLVDPSAPPSGRRRSASVARDDAVR